MKAHQIYIVIVIFFISSFVNLKAEEEITSLGPLHITSFYGLLSLEGFYKTQFNQLNEGLSEKERILGYRGKLQLTTQSYFWKPQLMKINLEAEYNPNAQQKKYIVAPDYSENITAERGYAGVSFLEGYFLPFNIYGSYSHSYTNRDNANDIEIFSKIYGGGLGINNPVLPLNFTYVKSKTNQIELLSGNEYYYQNEGVYLSANRDIDEFARNTLTFSYEDYRTKYSNLDTMKNYLTNGNISSQFTFNSKWGTRLDGYLSYNSIQGFQNLLRYNGSANFMTNLPENFRFTSNYQYDKISILKHSTITHNIQSRIENQLYLSLRSFGYVNYSLAQNTSFKEKRNTYGIGFNYEKFIPLGKVFLNYELRMEKLNHQGNPVPLVILKEEYKLSNGAVTILKYPYITRSSIVVRNGNGTIIYQENIDYILTQKGNYFQISRIPGGLIADGDKVFIDYECSLQTSFKYDVFSNNVELRFNLFNNFLDVYSRYSGNAYNNVDTSSLMILHTLNKLTTGFQINKEGLTIGAEYENYNTNILPYQSYRSYIRYYNTFFSNKLSVILDGSFQYIGFKQDKRIQRIEEASANFIMPVNSWSSATMTGSFRNQDDPGTNLKYMTWKIGYEMRFLNTKFTLGAEQIKRSINNYANNYRALFLRIERTF